ncbi:MAG: polysaccharide pyruvyl transferase family protein [Aureliella sp.]
MRIGLLTLPFTWNYGGILQAFALKRVLTGLGHHVTVLDHRRHRSNWMEERLVTLKWKLIPILARIDLLRRNKIIAVESFKQSVFEAMTDPIYTKQGLRNAVQSIGIEAIIVGSDQVWNRAAAPRLLSYYLDFTEGQKLLRRVAYAASLSKPVWTYDSNETEACKKLLQKFDYVSVRESDAVQLIRDNLSFECNHDVDPCLLLSKDDFLRYATCDVGGSGFSYILDRSHYKSNLVKSLSSELKIPFRCIDDIGIPSVENWLGRFASADFVVTDSYHGTVFSIIFNKPFFSVLNESRGSSRFVSLLSQLGLQDRLIKEDQTIDGLEKRIAWSEVNRKWSDLRKKSSERLAAALCD